MKYSKWLNNGTILFVRVLSLVTQKIDRVPKLFIWIKMFQEQTARLPLMKSLTYPFHVYSKTQVPFIRSDLFALTEIFPPFSFKIFPILWRTMDSSLP